MNTYQTLFFCRCLISMALIIVGAILTYQNIDNWWIILAGFLSIPSISHLKVTITKDNE